MNDHRGRGRRRSRVAAAATGAALLIAAACSPNEQPHEARSRQPSSTTGHDSGSASTLETPANSTDPTGRPDRGVASVPRPTLAAPVAGVYRYRGVNDEFEIAVARLGTQGGGLRVSQRRGNTTDVEEWTDGHRALVEQEQQSDQSHNSAGEGGRRKVVCSWQPKLTVLKFPLKIGEEWTTRSECRPPKGEGGIVTTRERVAEVTRIESVTVAGKQLSAWVVHVVETIRYHSISPEQDPTVSTPESAPPAQNPAVDATTRREFDEFFAPDVAMAVRIVGSATSTIAPGATRFDDRLVAGPRT